MTRSGSGWAIVSGAIVVSVAVGWFASAQPSTPEEELAQAFASERVQETHAIMTRQHERIHALLDGFLLGDLESVNRFADEIASDMNQVPLAFPPEPGREEAQWDAMTKIIDYAERIRSQAAIGKYEQAHQQFAEMTRQCMRCHQARRTWGTFPEGRELPVGTPQDQTVQ